MGPEHELLRSFQYPQIACDLLMSEHPRVAEVLLADAVSDPSNCLLYRLLEYFNGEPNYVLSSYVVKVLSALFFHHPVRVQEFLFIHDFPRRMLGFLASRSVSEFIIKLIVVEDDSLLLLYFE